VEIALVALAGVVAFVGALSLRGDSFVVRRRIRSARRWTIAELPESTLGRIVGRVRAIGELLHSPLTGRPCVGFVAEVYSEFSLGGIYREARSVPFVIEDESGRALVDSHTEQARLDVELEITGACGRAAAMQAENAIFARRGSGPATKLEDWTFREGIITPGAS
jgi:hypothetical protein